jgi:hypothetical protein
MPCLSPPPNQTLLIILAPTGFSLYKIYFVAVMPSIPAYTVFILFSFILPSFACPPLPRQLDTKFEGHTSPPTTALGSLPEPPKPKCVYSCPQRDGENRGLIAKVDALGYEQGYSIFECVYVLLLFRSSKSE